MLTLLDDNFQQHFQALLLTNDALTSFICLKCAYAVMFFFLLGNPTSDVMIVAR